MIRHNTVAEYIENSGDYKESLLLLREIILSSGLDENLNWRAPVYSYQNKNLVGIAAFKSYCGLWFFQGGLLKDKDKKLINAQKDLSKALRQWRFKNIDEIRDNAEFIINYIDETIENQKQGKEIKPIKNKPLVIPDELKQALNADSNLKLAFEAFTLSKKREFAIHIAGAKQEATKQKRLAKIIPMILEGVGFNDKYR